jgi:hypothetical protein
MTPISSLTAVAQANQVNATQARSSHRHGAHFIMTEGSTSTGTSGNAGAVQSFADILAGVTGGVAKAAGAAKTLLG